MCLTSPGGLTLALEHILACFERKAAVLLISIFENEAQLELE